MTCDCGFENPGNLAFCGGCGRSLGQSCATCQQLSPGHFRFCGHCGRALREAPVAERRPLTVMFCDLADSTRLSGELDAEKLREVVLSYQGFCARAIERRGGYVSQYLGDGILAYFGYPRADEYSTARAVAAGLEMQAEVERHNLQTSVPLGVRVGLHTGWVVMGEMGGGEHRERLALGEAPNVAARIQGLAPVGGVAVSQDTHRLCQGIFVWDSMGSHELKGVTRQMAVHRALRMRSSMVLRPRRPLVGRDLELAWLEQRAERLRSRRGATVLVSGEAGIGKSTLVATLLERLDPSLRRFELRCSPFFQNSPYYPVEEAYRALTGCGADEDWIGVYARQQGLSIGEATGLREAFQSEVRCERSRGDVQRWLARPMVSDEGVVVVIEDLHWADPSTLAWIEFLVHQTAEHPALLVLTARPEHRPPWAVEQLALSPLPVEAVRSMVAELRPDLSEATRREIEGRGDGNPLFVEELTHAAGEGGVPESLAASLMARLDQLGPARELAQIASVLGREFPSSLLRALTPPSCEGALGQLVEAEILFPAERSGYIFKHALLAEAAYESMLLSTRRDLHARVATLLPELFPDLSADHPELLAHHWARAERYAEAVRGYREAGHKAAMRSAESEALEHLELAEKLLEHLPEGPARDREELSLLASLGSALLITAGNSAPEVAATFERAERLLERVGDGGDGSAASVVLYGLFTHAFVRGELTEAERFSQMMLAQPQLSGAPLVVAHLCHCQILWLLGRFAQSLAAITRACEALEEGPSGEEFVCIYSTDLGAHVRVDRGILEWYLGRPEEALEWGLAAVEGTRPTGHRFSLRSVEWNLARIHLARGDREDALEVAMRSANLHGPPADWLSATAHEAPAARLVLGLALCENGEIDLGLTMLERALAQREERGALSIQTMWVTCYAEHLLRVGRIDEALSRLERVEAEVVPCGERFYLSELWRVRGRAYLLRGNREAANECLESAQRLAREQGSPPLQLRAARDAALLASSAGGRKRNSARRG